MNGAIRRMHSILALAVSLGMATAIPSVAEEGKNGPATSPAPQTAPIAQTGPAVSTAPAASAPAGEPKPGEKKPETIPLSFKDAPMDEIAKFLTDRLGKPVVIDPQVKEVKITVVNPKPLPPEEAMYVLQTVLQEYGVAVEQRERTVHLIPIAEVIRRQIRTVPVDQDVRTITPSNEIVRKFFGLKYYDPTKLIDVLKPLLPSKYGHITADATSKRLMVVASVERLITVSRVIEELDRPDVSGGELRVFQLRYVDVMEVVPMLEKLIAGYLGMEVKAVASAGGGGEGAKPPEREGGPKPPEGPPKPEAAAAMGAVAIKAEKTPVLVIPEPRRSEIVVAAPTNILDQIGTWLETLDQPKPPSTQWELVEIEYGSAGDLARQLSEMLNKIPDESLRSAIKVFPFASSRRLMIIGSEENRKIIHQWLEQLDVSDTGEMVQRTFTLKYADAGQVSQNIKDLFGESRQRSYSFYDYYFDRSREQAEKVTVTSNTRSNSVTVQASPATMERVARQIEEWDKPLEGEQAAPLIITLKYADPQKTKELLASLFTEQEKPVFDWWGRFTNEGRPSPVGRLYGQFSFEAYPELGKLIVISKNEENYDVIREMIAQIDSPQEAGVPRTILLKFADAETVAEQLNALLNAPGTPTSILRRGRIKGGFEQFDDRSPYSQATQNQPRTTAQPQQQDQAQTATMTFWWQQPAPPREIETRQPSNLVGKLRIVPNIERNMLLVAVPDEYAEVVQTLIQELDRPGYQVLIRAIIAEITLDDSMSLGFRFSTDPNAFISGDPAITENALRGLFTYQFKDTHANTHTFTFDGSVNGLVSLLGKLTDLKIRSEPKILTADNVEGEFFDGQDIPFIQNSRVLDVGTSDTFDYFPVGITLRVRPHITQEKTINLVVKLRVSSVVPGRTLFGGAIVDRRETTTQITLEHGKTFMISGILREVDRQIIRKVPGLGDIPLLGELFKHRETAKVNTELLVLLTPYIIGPKGVEGFPRDSIEDEPRDRLEQYWPGAPPPDDGQAPFGAPDEKPNPEPGKTPGPKPGEQLSGVLPEPPAEGG